MPASIILMKFTDQGIRNIRQAPERIHEGIKKYEAMGGKLIGFYATMGEYDYVAIGETPNDEVGMTFALGLGAQGNVRTTTMKAFTVEEFTNMVSKLP
jgi:uncharacterized protein with GYD domain